jgi:hypothetical protein
MADHEDEEPATIDMAERVRTWRLFVAFFKWHLVVLGGLLLILLIFRTHG